MVFSSLKKAGLKEKLLWFLGQRKRFKIEGQSMEPLLKHGDIIFVKSTRNISREDLIICRHPIQSDIVLAKQIDEIKGNQINVKGLNFSESSDSRTFGSIPKKYILGIITSKLNHVNLEMEV